MPVNLKSWPKPSLLQSSWLAMLATLGVVASTVTACKVTNSASHPQGSAFSCLNAETLTVKEPLDEVLPFSASQGARTITLEAGDATRSEASITYLGEGFVNKVYRFRTGSGEVKVLKVFNGLCTNLFNSEKELFTTVRAELAKAGGDSQNLAAFLLPTDAATVVIGDRRFPAMVKPYVSGQTLSDLELSGKLTAAVNAQLDELYVAVRGAYIYGKQTWDYTSENLLWDKEQQALRVVDAQLATDEDLTFAQLLQPKSKYLMTRYEKDPLGPLLVKAGVDPRSSPAAVDGDQPDAQRDSASDKGSASAGDAAVRRGR